MTTLNRIVLALAALLMPLTIWRTAELVWPVEPLLAISVTAALVYTGVSFVCFAWWDK